MILLWLDDVRPAPDGWTHAKTIEEAKQLLEQGDVLTASLDHDLGACADCMAGRTPEEWLEQDGYKSMPNCSHVGTGWDLVIWMAEKGHWPKQKPTVHSANPYGRMRMNDLINRYFGQPAQAA